MCESQVSLKEHWIKDARNFFKVLLCLTKVFCEWIRTDVVAFDSLFLALLRQGIPSKHSVSPFFRETYKLSKPVRKESSYPDLHEEQELPNNLSNTRQAFSDSRDIDARTVVLTASFGSFICMKYANKNSILSFKADDLLFEVNLPSDCLWEKTFVDTTLLSKCCDKGW